MKSANGAITPSSVAIPLKQGQVFNSPKTLPKGKSHVAIPLKQGQVFNDMGGAE